jgi:putative heme-binding domain-containing protein
VNCSHCHQFNAGGAANIALGFEVPLDQTKTVGVHPIQGTFNITGARIIAPGDPEGSVLYYRISKLGGGRMPRVGSNQVDERFTRLIHDWIKQMKAPEGAASAIAERKAREEDRSALSSLRQANNTSSETRAAAIRRLASSTRGGLLLLGFLNQASPTQEFRNLVVSITRTSPQIEVRDLFERYIPESERIKRLGDTIDRQALLAMKGDAERGKTVFATNPAAQCKTCHKIGPLGESVGPDLSKIGTKYDRATILEHIIDPSRTIDQQYVSQLVETKDGQVVTGLVAERTKSAIVIKDVQGKTTVIPSDQVEQLSPQPRSLMPELLLRDLTAQQAADLIEFLAVQK